MICTERCSPLPRLDLPGPEEMAGAGAPTMTI
jgi:hypothetical protein